MYIYIYFGEIHLSRNLEKGYKVGNFVEIVGPFQEMYYIICSVIYPSFALYSLTLMYVLIVTVYLYCIPLTIFIVNNSINII